MVKTYTEDAEEGIALKSDGVACSAIREDLKDCVLSSDCVRIHHIHPKKCLTERLHDLPEECAHLRTLLYECKRSMLDPRARFRGRKGY